MAAGFAAGPYHLSVIAETGDRFADFAPYVAAIDDGGVVVFSAALTTGGSGVFRGDGTRVATVADSTPGTFQQVSSHPDIDGTGSVCFYAEDAVGGAALHWSRDGEIVRLSEVAGPLGPTMNSEGTIGFRAPPVGGDGIYTGPDPEHDRLLAIGDQLLDSTVTGFALNPVSINDAGQLAIRIALESGRQLIVRADRDNAGDNVPY